MANEEQIYIEEREDGKYAIRRGNSERASAVAETQEEAVEVAVGCFQASTRISSALEM